MTQQAWTILSNIFRSSSRARTMYTKSELHGLRQGTLSILDYVEKKHAIADNLASTNNGVSEEELIQCNLTGLDVKFGIFCSALNAHSPFDNNLAVKLLMEMLYNEENRLKVDEQVQE